MQQLTKKQHDEQRERRVARSPFISVIVPVRNEAAFIADTLHQLLEQQYDSQRFEVIVADGRSTDETCTIVTALKTRYANLRLIDNAKRWSSAARNAAIRASQGDLILLIDGHCQINNPRYLHELASAFADSGADCVGRPQPLDVTGANSVQRAIALARKSWLGHHPASHVYSQKEGFVPPQSVAIAYRRSVFDMIGLFDERFDACEDVEFNHRLAKAGLKCWFTPRAQVHYFPRSHLSGLFRQMVRYGRGRVRLVRIHGDTFSLSCFVPAVFLAGIILGPLAGFASSLLLLLYVGVLAIYSATVLSVSSTLCLRARDARLLPLLPLVFLMIHVGAGTGIWSELLFGSPRESASRAS